MIDDGYLDGNAIGGLLHELFGRDMTSDLGRCGNCGAINPIGVVRVYGGAPGHVMRCPACLGVLMVIVETRRARRINFEALGWIEFGLE